MRRFCVPLLDDELDVELGLRIVECVDRLDQVLDDARLTIERGDDGIIGKLVIRKVGGVDFRPVQ